MGVLEPQGARQREILARAVEIAVDHGERVRELPVAPSDTAPQVRAWLDSLDVESPRSPEEVVDRLAELLRDGTVHTTHPRYFGLFNPTPSFMGIVADLLAAAFNPQLAASSHAPAAVEIESWTVRYLAERLGLGPSVGGSFTSGGAEANASAVHLALTRALPQAGEIGLARTGVEPTVYASAESHLAWLKIAQVTGIGRRSVRLVPVDRELRMDLAALRELIDEDRAAGRLPVLVVGTAGTTSAGAVDPLEELSSIATTAGASFHVDAAWAGAVALSDSLRGHLAGIERADSVTLDPHKWLSVPMGAGIFLTRHPELLARTYGVATHYMPDPVDTAPDPYTHSVQWSRRFAGLKLFATLATVGRSGYAAQLEHDVALGDRLRTGLASDEWRIVSSTPLPVVCFADPARPDDLAHHEALAARVVAGGEVWISSTVVAGEPCLRACITSHRTTADDVDALVRLLRAARDAAPDPS